MIASKADSSLGYLPLRDSGAVDVANLVSRLLPSKEGVVLRRLLMTAVSPLMLVPFFRCIYNIVKMTLFINHHTGNVKYTPIMDITHLVLGLEAKRIVW